MGKEKYKNLDGLRGLAALIVVFCHYSNAFFPSIHGWSGLTTHTHYDKFIATTPLHLLFGGDFAVAIFFVLSGFVLSNKFFRTKDIGVVISSASRRYLRLMLPALGSVLLVYLFMKVGAVRDDVHHPSVWMAHFWNSPASIFTAFYQGTYGVFFTNFYTYNPVLWTMHYELFGSFLVFLFLVLFGKLDKRWLLYIAFALIFIKTYYLPFILGMAISGLWSDERTKDRVLGEKTAWGLLAIGLLMGSWYISETYHGIYNLVSIPAFTPQETATLFQTVGAALTMVSIMRLPILTRFFITRPMQYLGRVSFALYLTHFVILGSIANIMYGYISRHAGTVFSISATAVTGIALTLVVSSVFTKLIDEKSISLSKRFGDWLLRPTRSRQRSGTSEELSGNPTELIPRVQIGGVVD